MTCHYAPVDSASRHPRLRAVRALVLSLTLSLVLGLTLALGNAAPARADDTAASADDTNIAQNPTLQPAAPSGFETQKIDGQPFFLLSDASFGSDQLAQVRLEAPGREFKDQLAGYGGADIVVYRVPKPIEFLKAQKNLHRLNIAPNYQGEGLANTLAYLWDRWITEARRAWQRVLSFATRSKATESEPQLKLGDQLAQPSHFAQNMQFAPLKGYDLVGRFRYPIWDAKTIQPPKGVELAGSSSNFIEASSGNVMIPVGKLPPGLYIVEAIIGNYRAHTLLFVSDTVAVVKAASSGMLVWTARRDNGKPVPNTAVSWTDGVGVLQSGSTGNDGALALDHVSPERSYVIGSDPAGGVFVSENFYYDSEIYNTKIYAVTDRPMYRPGDRVYVKFIGRTFQNATQSSAPAEADIKLDVLDPSGSPISTSTTHFASDTGAQATFTIPADATAGGYTLRFDYNGDIYGSAFRVAEYVKPHFDVNLSMDKPDYATGEALHGKIQLRYPDGKPVKDSKISVTLRAQQVTIVDGELRYAGLFPVKLEQQELETDSDGNASLTLPAAKEPSRYALTLFARDGAAYRVRVTREVLIARGVTPYRLAAAKSFSQPKERVDFTLQALGAVDPSAHAPAKWEWVRLESQTHSEGTIGNAKAGGTVTIPVQFDEPGSYMLSVKDDTGNLLGATSHWVAGDGVKAIPGSVEIVFDRDRYKIGDTAEALITFPQPVDDALLTLERDKVEHRALLTSGADWLSLQRVAPSQWKARIKVDTNFAPNMTFSVLYVHAGEYVFQNAGIVVAQPTIDLEVKSDKPVYGPGDTVTLDLTSAMNGKPLPADLTVSVVDEMVYVLQPEIAPSIVDFFYHPRRNNVRTSSSLSFITYDLALSSLRGAPGGPQRERYNERGVKVLERPRRDDQDTAAWEPDLKTDASGHVKMTFKMPDALARWRITVRAASADGMVGQRTAYVRSDKALYLKWSGPAHFRANDKPSIDMLAFNQANTDVQADWIVDGGGLSVNQKVTLKPGANYLKLPVVAMKPGVVDATLRQGGKDVDRLQTSIALDATGWLDLHQTPVALDAAGKPLNLAADAQDVSVRLMSSGASQFARVADDLIAYPYGCAEQTSSRLIPLALAHDALSRGGSASTSATQGVEAQLRNQRQRLALLAGVGGTFGWWGDTTGGSSLITAYAYYADWLASRSLAISLPADNWQHAMDVYRDAGAKEPLLHRALALWFMQQMGLPVTTPLSGVAQQLMQAQTSKDTATASGPGFGPEDSIVFANPDSARGTQLALVLTAYMARSAAGVQLPDGFDGAVSAARGALATDPAPLVQSLLVMTGATGGSGADGAAPVDAVALLAKSSASYPTFDRALTLLWLRKALGGDADSTPLPELQGAGWQRNTTPTGAAVWKWTGTGLPQSVDVGAVRPDVTALVSYRSRAADTSRLPVTVERHLYKLVPSTPAATDKKNAKKSDTSDADAAARFTFTAEAVKPGDALDSNALYVDEVTLTPPANTAYQYGLLEVPLPPGGEVEATSWGISIDGLPGPASEGGSGPQPFQRAVTYEMGELNYHQPVPLLDRRVALRQLVRFGLPGTFVVPPARYFRMYQPDAKAFEGGKSDRLITMKIG
ncbi:MULTISPECIES: alpha-2-macroglobulin [Paraburkholderia]|uniref:alpha-2-macroglobulin family protein n=1 Tax=Paraburkholderia TaxID=1822464 RepID=UPI0022598187|nr:MULTISPECIES: alpha-2-macroglobulin [Paraburkholderia]MCX4162830.1 alpha-2-macroglobulin [Paraburkholderia megapolitana]MDN7158325.1 alpha-2-macroglobulin family protein [Paraburkholderia sp. CHISQ3]MDQ6495372.1 alpha-2-macroglobulin family protein [Paraburkholderia megapolitana]